MSKIIRVSKDLDITVHDFPEGSLSEKSQKLKKLISEDCEMYESVMPKRLYSELGHSNKAENKNSKCVSMLVDDNYLQNTSPDKVCPNLVGSLLYESDKNDWMIYGNILFVGLKNSTNGLEFTGIEPETFEKLYEQLIIIARELHSSND